MTGMNPILPLYEYIPDGEPRLFEGRVYLYGSHDKFNGNTFCMNDYVVYSADAKYLTTWKYEGISYSRIQDPRFREDQAGREFLYAPDVERGTDGRYYLYYCLNPHPEIGVAVSDNPAGPFAYYGLVKHKDGTPLGDKEGDLVQFDPGIFLDDDGSIYLFSGNAPRFRKQAGGSVRGSQVMQLEEDMLTLKKEPKMLLCSVNESEGSGFEGHEFFEASSMRKIDDTYYLIYSSVNLHELCYATSKYPDKEFTYGGVLISNVDLFHPEDQPLNAVGNNHGSMVEVEGMWYIFYHRHTNRNAYSRQACAERIYVKADGRIPQVEITTSGLSNKIEKQKSWLSAARACNIVGRYSESDPADKKYRPYVTQLGEDRETAPYSIVTNIQDDALIGFKYFNCDGLRSVTVSVRGDFVGTLEVTDELDGSAKGTITIEAEEDWKTFTGEVTGMCGDSAIYFWAKGEGTLQFEQFKMNYNEQKNGEKG